ncbi:hypothetical protein DFA_04828 [Cavenderia fasciculata]|uniref:Protein LTV1 n=1 Tax=Cavenderia fasciculata TaxID=261658 RepID=F4PLU2_CACFS|nr:uncharacterized protein DFA_04828 [Cavenderia fasciculata]EGG22698.1 hypothetical protein DFA_04828 [Cavenderia fasciculata]|eukprot:XP_004360549.1 hypothetical protein DFA_04828 [Cavenderia fasciculata]
MSKSFVDRKDRVTYTLYRNSAVDRQGRSINELVQKQKQEKSTKQNNNSRRIAGGDEDYDEDDEYYDDDDDEYYDDDQEEYDDDQEDDQEENDDDQEDGKKKKEDDDLHLIGFRKDGYDYSKHLKPIGGGIFIPAVYDLSTLKNVKGGIVGLIRESEPTPYMYGLEEISKHYVKNEKELSGVVDSDLIDAMGSDDGEFEDLDDDFILQANGGNLDGLDEQVKEARRKLKSLELLDDDEQDEGDRIAGRHVDEELEADFEAALEEYDDDEIGELDRDVARGQFSTDQYEQVFDEFMDEYKKNHTPFIDQLIQLKREDPTIALTAQEKIEILERDWESSSSEDEDEGEDREVWDCETILTTYTNIYNHPSTIREEGIKKIQLSKKTGIPLGVLPTRTREIEEEEERINYGEAIEKDESKEDKKERKKAVKELKKAAREQKKDLKQAFKSEEMKQNKINRAQRLNKATAVQF